MDSDLIIIFPAIIVMLAIIGATVNGIVGKVLDYKRDKAGISRDGYSRMQVDAGQNDRTELIEDRLAVLERLATDKGTLLSDEIEALRLDVSERREKEKSR